MRVLHITNWYPNPVDPVDAQFIKDQIDALHLYAHSDVMHIQVREGRFRWLSYQHSDRERGWILFTPFQSWFLKEIIISFLLFYFLIKNRRKRYDVINFHIAYPLLTYFHLFSKAVKNPVVVTEHWSAYRTNFGSKKELKRIKRIFQYQKNIITVSKSLSRDIATFSGCQDLKFSILPNVLSEAFQELPTAEIQKNKDIHFFMVSCWQPPKQPLVILKALAQLKEEGLNFKLRIGGYGILEPEIKHAIADFYLNECATYIGKLSYQSVATELNRCDYFLHASDYETFSVVCLEALWQGVPVIASNVGGIPEFVNNTNGILVSSNLVDDWIQAIKSLPVNFDRVALQQETRLKFSNQATGQKYYTILQTYITN
ncbi:MAG: glycosyltransferase [Bacteroidetes bacterium]|nr:glycosyltransferase [Bacteroidota bacterium]